MMSHLDTRDLLELQHAVLYVSDLHFIFLYSQANT